VSERAKFYAFRRSADTEQNRFFLPRCTQVQRRRYISYVGARFAFVQKGLTHPDGVCVLGYTVKYVRRGTGKGGRPRLQYRFRSCTRCCCGYEQHTDDYYGGVYDPEENAILLHVPRLIFITHQFSPTFFKVEHPGKKEKRKFRIDPALHHTERL